MQSTFKEVHEQKQPIKHLWENPGPLGGLGAHCRSSLGRTTRTSTVRVTRRTEEVTALSLGIQSYLLSK